MESKNAPKGNFTISELNLIHSLIRRYLEIILNDLPKLNNQNASHRSKIYLFNYLERLYFAWNSINQIIPCLTQIQHFYPIGLIARSIIVDSITLIYLIDSLEVDQENNIMDERKFLKACKRFDFDFIKAKFLLADEANIKESEKQKMMEQQHKSIQHIYNDFFNFRNGKYHIGSMPRLNVDEMRKNKNSPTSKKAFFLFKVYSQYEHCSIFSKDLHTDYKRANLGFLLDTFTISAGQTMDILLVLKQNETAQKIHDEVLAEIHKLYKEIFPNPI